jgi:hypothetical protein
MTAKARIEAAAAANGWTEFERNYVGSLIEYRKGRRYVRVYFKATEQVQSGSYGNSHRSRRLSPTGQADQILALLAK